MSLAYAFELSASSARKIEELYDGSAGDARRALLLARWLDDRMARHDSDAVVAHWATQVAHEIADRVEFDPVLYELPNLRLPCRGCGHVFATRIWGGKWLRECGICDDYAPKVPGHPRGGLVQVKHGDYPKHRPGQSLGVTEYGTSIVCAHPDCLELVLVTRSDRDYCNQHFGKREEARRLRRSRPAKCERFAFSLAPEVTDVTYAWGARAEVTEVGPAGRVARDDEELLTLVQLAASGALLVTDTLA